MSQFSRGLWPPPLGYATWWHDGGQPGSGLSEPLASGIRLRYVSREPLELGGMDMANPAIPGTGSLTVRLFSGPPPASTGPVVSGSGYTRGGPQSPVPAGVVPVNQPPSAVSGCNCAACQSSRQRFSRGAQSSYAPGGIASSPPVRSKPSAFRGVRGMDGFDGAPLVAGTPLGYRWWTLTAPRLHLDPAGAGKNWIPGYLRGAKDFWQPGVNKAKCLAAGDRRHDFSEIPCDSCADGYWAYWEIQSHDLGRAGELPVIGVVKASGQVILGPRGFRAQKAEIIALHLPFRIEPDIPRHRPQDEDMVTRALRGQPGRTPARPWMQHPRFTGRVISFPGAPPVPAPLASPPEPEPPADEEIKAAKDTAEAWMAVIEDRLAVTYPGAEVCATLDLMKAKYPVTSEYEPPEPREVTRPCPYCGAPCTPDTIHRHVIQNHGL